MDIDSLKYPVGRYFPNKNPSREQIKEWLAVIEDLPMRLERLMNGVTIEQLDWRYRPGGWKVKQVVHHLADSHMNSIMRFKLALTENTPAIRPYNEKLWAELFDAYDDDIAPTLTLLNGLHKRMVVLFKGLSDDQLKLEFLHPEHGKQFNLAETIGNYAWHSNHHLAHIKNGLESNGKYN